jgi:hypothetical protein
VGALVAIIAEFATGLLTAIGAFTIRSFLIGLFMAALGVVIYNILAYLMSDVLSWAMSHASNLESPGNVSNNMSLTGVTAYFLDMFQVPSAIAVLVSCISIRMSLKLIPFLKW